MVTTGSSSLSILHNQDKAKDSPEEKRQKFVDEEVKEKEEFVDEIDDIEVLRSLYKKDCRSHVRRRLLQEEEKAEFKSKFEASERDKHTAELLAKSLKVKLRARKTIEQKERNLFPHWLLIKENISRKQKWEVYLHFRLTPEANILVSRITKLGSKIELVALSVHELYEKWSCEYHEIEELEMEDDSDWNQLYKDVGIEIKRQKIGLRIIIENINHPQVTVPNYASRSGYVFLANINWYANNTEIKSFCVSKNITVQNILHLKDVRNRQTGTVVLEVNDVDLCRTVFTNANTSFTAPHQSIVISSENLHADTTN